MTTETDGITPADETTLPQDAAVTDQAATTAETEAQPGDDAAAATDEATGEPAPRKQTAQERIDDVTRARRAAERDADYWRNEAQRLQQQVAKPAEPAAPADDAPDPSKYEAGEYDTAYIKDLARYEARQEFAKQADEQKARDAQAAYNATVNAKIEEAKAKRDDFEDVVLKGKWDCSQTMAQAILDSPESGELAYHLAKNPTEARRIAGLTPIAQVMEVARLEARLSAPKATPVKTATQAPEPAPQTRGTSGQFKVSADTNDFAAFDKAY